VTVLTVVGRRLGWNVGLALVGTAEAAKGITVGELVGFEVMSVGSTEGTE
jgi:hypothetical protein